MIAARKLALAHANDRHSVHDFIAFGKETGKDLELDREREISKDIAR